MVTNEKDSLKNQVMDQYHFHSHSIPKKINIQNHYKGSRVIDMGGIEKDLSRRGLAIEYNLGKKIDKTSFHIPKVAHFYSQLFEKTSFHYKV